MKKQATMRNKPNARQHPPERPTRSIHALEEATDTLVFQSIELHNVTLEKGTQLHATINFALPEGGKYAQLKGKIETKTQEQKETSYH